MNDILFLLCVVAVMIAIAIFINRKVDKVLERERNKKNKKKKRRK